MFRQTALFPAKMLLPAVVLLLAQWSAGAALAAGDKARFEIDVAITWSTETAPFEFPDNPHMSGLIGATHTARYVLFRDGHTASSGLERVAENGRTGVLKAEFDEAARRGRVGTVVEGPGLQPSPGNIHTEFETTKDHPYLSLVTMIAPSPDWFTGAADIPLTKNGVWIEEVQVVLWAWDAGTDSGSTYDAKNADTQPRESVRLLASPHFLQARSLAPVGAVRVRRLQP